MKQKKVEVGAPLRLRADCCHYDFEAIEVIVGYDHENIVEVCLGLSTDLATLHRIETNGDLHLTPDVRLPAAAEGFHADSPVLIDVRLDSNLLRSIPTDPTAVAELLKQPLGKSPALLDASAWYVLTVSQSRGFVSTGYATTWFVEI